MCTTSQSPALGTRAAACSRRETQARVRLMTCLYQLMGQPEHRRLGLQRVLERPETYTPGGELRFGLRVLIQLDKAGQ